MKCHKCKSEFGEIAGYKLSKLDEEWLFCGRLCLVEWIAPEMNKVCVPRQWIPTPEEQERMAQ